MSINMKESNQKVEPLDENLRKDYTQEIEKLKLQTGKEEDAVQEAKRLRNEIEEEMGKSFEMIEEKHNEVKDFLHKREKEEEEHKKRAEDILKRLKDGMMDTEDDAIKKGPSERAIFQERHRDSSKADDDKSEGFFEFDSSSTQTDVIQQISQHIQVVPDELDDVSQRKDTGLNSHGIKEENIPDIIEAIKENLIEKMKQNLTEVEEKLAGEAKTDGNTVQNTSTEVPRINQTGGKSQDAKDIVGKSDELLRKLEELARSVTENKVNDERLSDALKDTLDEHKNELIDKLLQNAKNVNEIPGLSDDENKDLQETYAEMQTDFENLSKLVLPSQNHEHNTGEGRLMKCRELCKEIDKIESDLEELNSQMLLLQEESEKKDNGFVDDSESGQDQGMSEYSGPFRHQVAEFETRYADDNGIYNGKEAPAKEVGGRRLTELMKNKIDADARLKSKLEDLRTMLGQREEIATKETNSPSASKEDLEEGKEMSKNVAELENANFQLQKELDKAYIANKVLAEENRRLLQGSDTRIPEKMDEELFSSTLEIPRWQSENQLSKKLARAEAGIGDNLFRVLISDETPERKPLVEMKDFEILQLEGNTVADLLKLHRENEMMVAERLTAADVKNAINDLLKESRTDTNKLIADLQNEAENVDLDIAQKEAQVQNTEEDLNKLIEKRLGEINESNAMQAEIADLEKKLVTVNNTITNCFLASEKDNGLDNLDEKLADVDRQIEQIGLELKRDLDIENSTSDENLRDTAGLRKLLEKLKPYAAEEKMKRNDVIESYKVPTEEEVDEIIKDKVEALRQRDQLQVGGTHEEAKFAKSKQDDKRQTRTGDNQAGSGNQGQLEQLQNDLQLIEGELGTLDVRAEDMPFLKEAISSLKSAIVETNEKVENAGKRSQEETNESLDEIDEQIENLKKQLTDIALEGSRKNEQSKVAGDSEEEITRENAKEKIERLCGMLGHEKERVTDIIISMESLAEDIKDSKELKFAEFKKRFEVKTNELKAEMEERLDSVNRVLRDASDALKSSEIEEENEKKNIVLEEKRAKLVEMNQKIATTKFDLEGIKIFEKEGQIGDLDNSDIEELLYKIEAIEISIERMGRTISDAKEEGDTRTLDTLLKRQKRMNDSLEAVQQELANQKSVLGRDLSDLLAERRRIEEEVNEMLGEGTIENGGEREAILEIISGCFETSESGREDLELEKRVLQRAKFAESYEDFDKLGGLKEKDGKLLEDMILSTELDIGDRLEEIDEICKGYDLDESLALNKAYLQNMVQQRSELHCALQQLGKFDERYRNSQEGEENGDAGVQMEMHSKFEELRRLREVKLSLIDDKLDTLNRILESPVFKDSFKNGETSAEEMMEDDDEEVIATIREVKEEFNSIRLIGDAEDDWSGLTDSLVNEIKLRNEMDADISSLLDAREELIDKYVQDITNEGSENGREEHLGRIAETDQKIKDQGEIFVRALLRTKDGEEVASNEEDDKLKQLIAKRDVTMRQLFALKAKEGQRGHTATEKQKVDEASPLGRDFQEELNTQDLRILEYKSRGQSEEVERVQSPNLYAVLRKVYDETETLKNEVENDEILLRDCKPRDTMMETNLAADVTVSELDKDSNNNIEMKVAQIEAKIEDLEEKRTEIILNEKDVDSDEEVDETEMIQNIGDMKEALEDFERKLRVLERREDLVKQIENIVSDSEVLGVDIDRSQLQKEYDQISEELDSVDLQIAKFINAIRNELDKKDILSPAKRKGDELDVKDKKELYDVLQCKLNDLIKQRMSIEEAKEKVARVNGNKGELKELVDDRKDIIQKLDEMYKLYTDGLADDSNSRCIHDKRQDYLKEKEEINFLEKKKQEIAKCLESLEATGEASLENSTSGFSDVEDTQEKIESLEMANQEKDELISEMAEQISALEEQILDLEQESEILKNSFIEKEDNMSKEIKKLNKEKDSITNMLEAEKDKNKEMGKQLTKLDKLKEELKLKGRRIVKIENEDIQSMSPTKEDLIEDGKVGDTDDLRHEIDKITAVEEIMKLAAELITENERRATDCRELEVEKKELTDMSEDLLNECEELRNEAEKCKMQVKEEEDRTGKMKLKMDELGQMLAMENENKKELINENEKLKSELEMIITDSEAVRNEAISFKKENSSLSDEIKELRKQLEFNENGGDNKHKTIIEKEYEIVPSEARHLMNESDSAVDVEEFNEKGEKNDPGGTETQKDAARLEIEKLLEEIRSLSLANEILDDKMMLEQKRRKMLDDRCKQLESLLSEKNREIEDDKAENAKLRSTNKSLELQSEEFEDEIKKAWREKGVTASQARDAEEERDKLLEAFNKLKDKLHQERQQSFDEKEKLSEELRRRANEISRLKNNKELEMDEVEKKLLSKERKLNKLEFQLAEENEAYEELVRNFDRVKKAKESIMADYEKQLQGLGAEMSRLKKIETAMGLENSALSDEIRLLKDKLSKMNIKSAQQRDKLEQLANENQNEMKAMVDQASQAKTQLTRKINELDERKARLEDAAVKKEAQIQQLQEKNSELQEGVTRKDQKIEELEECLQRTSRLGGTIGREYEMIQQGYEEKLQAAKMDMYAKEKDNEIIEERLNKKNAELNDTRLQLQKETRDLRKRITELELEAENTRVRHEMKRADSENLIAKIENKLAQNGEKVSKREAENQKLKIDLKNMEKLLAQMRERREVEIKSLEMMMKDMEDRCTMLQEKNVNMKEKLVKEIEEKEELKTIANHYLVIKDENIVLREKVLEISENQEAKKEAERLSSELQKVKDKYEKIKHESIQVLKHSNNMKHEIKRLKSQVLESAQENEKEQNLLVENLEAEFRKRIEEIIKGNLKEKEKLLDMWDEERENWEEEMKDEMENSRYDLERKLKEQKEDMEDEHMKKFAKLLNENKRVVNELNERLRELEIERSRMEQKFDDEIKSIENQYVGEKEYMAVMIRELLRNIIDNKYKQSQLKQSHMNEVKSIEDKFEQDKRSMDMRLKEELQLLREKVTELLKKDTGRRNGKREYSRMDDQLLLDFVPRKL